MAKQAVFVGGMAVAKILNDEDWIRIIGALSNDRSPESKKLADRLLTSTKHGRQIRLLRLIAKKGPRFDDMQKAMKVSRRTIFRDMLDLESYGVKLYIDENYSYQVDKIPPILKRLA